MTDHEIGGVRLLSEYPEKLARSTIFYFGVRSETMTSARVELLKVHNSGAEDKGTVIVRYC